MTTPPSPAPTSIPLATPNADVDVTIEVQTPLITNCWLWALRPGGAWQQFGESEMSAAVAAGTHTHTLTSVAKSTQVMVTLSFVGPVGAPANAKVTFAQGGKPLADPMPVTPTATHGNAQAGQIDAVLT